MKKVLQLHINLRIPRINMKTYSIMNIWRNRYKQEVLEHNITLKESIEMLANQLNMTYKQTINLLYCL